MTRASGPNPVRRRRRATLRARLIALVVGVAAIALVAVDVVLPVNLHSSLISGRDATLTSVINSLPVHIGAGSLASISNSTQLSGEIGWSLVNPSGTATVLVQVASDADANPGFGSKPPLREPATVQDAADASVSYRALGRALADPPGSYLVAWVPLADVQATVRRTILTELLVTAAILLLLGISAGLIIRRELKPLEKMARTADEIAGGDLDAQVITADSDTEVGRLAGAFNGMLNGLRALIAEREHSEERLRQFIADASHELRTPVAAVRGYTDLYDAGALADPASVDRAMNRMGFEARRMGALVDDLLTLIKADSEPATKREPVEMTDLLAGVVEDARAIDPHRSWWLNVGPGPQLVLGDRLRLHQLFANLLGNVRTHTPPGTAAVVSLLPAADHIAVTVSDNGPGVAPEQLSRLFDRFYRVDPSRSRENGGTGLGLAIVAAIVGSHQGRIVASSAPGGGLAMTVLLPRAFGTAAVRPTDRRAQAAAERPGAPESLTAGSVGTPGRPAAAVPSIEPAHRGPDDQLPEAGPR